MLVFYLLEVWNVLLEINDMITCFSREKKASLTKAYDIWYEGIDSIHRQLSFLSTLWRLWDRFTVSKLLLFPPCHLFMLGTLREEDRRIFLFFQKKPKKAIFRGVDVWLPIDGLSRAFCFGVSFFGRFLRSVESHKKRLFLLRAPLLWKTLLL